MTHSYDEMIYMTIIQYVQCGISIPKERAASLQKQRYLMYNNRYVIIHVLRDITKEASGDDGYTTKGNRGVIDVWIYDLDEN